ncbi:MAG: DUF4838 domain-containing protein [Lentisphaeria bacterium]|nr:DUF4838 domain-containing protein [Lentisphaeria bacterium]
MKYFFSILLGATIFSLHGALLVKDGEAKAQLVLPENAYPAEVKAASEFNLLLKKSTGVELPLVDNSSMKPGLLPVRIGRAAEKEKLPGNAGRIVSTEKELLLYGGDGSSSINTVKTETGSLFAVYELLEKELGVRWLWPDMEYGVVVKKMKTVDIPDMDILVTPALERVTFAHFPIEWARRAGRAHMKEVILPRNRRGHAFVNWYKMYGEKHPEYFALSKNGRLNKSNGPMCVANPAFHDEIIRIWQEERAKNPGRQVDINLCENDCKGSCICKLCTAWDAPDSPAGDVSERYARFYKTVYEKAVKIDPNVRVYGYAYSNYVNAPKHFKLPKNVVISYVPSPMQPYSKKARIEILGRISKWVESGCTLVYRPNLLGGYAMPEDISDDYYAEFQEMRKANMIAADICGPNNSFATQGPYIYVLSRMMINPDAELADLKEEYYSAFGSASKEVKAYWEYWHDYTMKNAELFHEIPKKYNPIRFSIFFGFHYAFYAHRLFPDEVFIPAEKLLDKALVAAAGNPEDLGRVKFLKAGLTHARLCSRACAVFNDPKSSTQERMAALNAVHEFRKNSLPQWASWTKRFTRNGENEQLAWVFNSFDPDSMFSLPLEWKFCADPLDQGRSKGFYDPAFDDSAWRMVKTDRLLEYQGISNYVNAWYRIQLTIPEKFRGHRTVIHFGAIDESCELWINGQAAGTFKFDHANNPDSWRQPKEFDITQFVPADGRITIALKVHNGQGRGGLWRPSHLHFFPGEEMKVRINAKEAPMDERSLQTFGKLISIKDDAYTLTGTGERRFSTIYLRQLKNPGDKLLTVTIEYRYTDKANISLTLLEKPIGKGKSLRAAEIKLPYSTEWKSVTRQIPLLPETRKLNLSVRYNIAPGNTIQIRNITFELGIKAAK